MKHLFVLILSLFSLTAFTPVNDGGKKGNDQDSVCDTKNTTFNSNEELRYKVYYNWNFVWIPAGVVDFSAEETTYAGKPSYLFKATGKTISTYDPVYKVRDHFHSYVNRETMEPLKYVRDTNEGGYTTYEELRFDYDNMKIKSMVGRSKDTAKKGKFDLNGCTFDVVSIMYKLRTIDLDNRKVGEKIPIKVFFDEEQYDLYVKYLGKKKVKVKGQGKFMTHKISPLLVAGDIFSDTDKMIIYVTADDNKLPVMVESPIKVGSVKAVIKSAKNLKYKVKAKVK